MSALRRILLRQAIDGARATVNQLDHELRTASPEREGYRASLTRQRDDAQARQARLEAELAAPTPATEGVAP